MIDYEREFEVPQYAAEKTALARTFAIVYGWMGAGMALWGVIVAMVVNLFVGSSGLDWLISFVAILIFTGLTMYDAQRIWEIADRERMFGRER